MTKTQIEVGAVVRTEVGGKQVNVRIEREIWKADRHTGWGGINLSTNRPATIKADAKMKRVEEPDETPAPAAAAPAKAPKGGKGKKAPKTAKPATAATDANVAAHVAPEREGLPPAATPAEAATGALFNAGAGGGGEPGVEGQVPADAKRESKNAAARDDKKNHRLPRSESAKPARLGVLGAAAQILGEASEPMGAGDIVSAMLERKLWFTSGKTPAATLYAAMIREIRDKGKEARFIKTGRGLFTLRAGAKETL